MENTFDQNKYKGLMNFFHTILKIFVIVLYIVLGMMTVGFIVVLFIPRGLLDVDLAVLSGFNERFTNFMEEMDPNYFVGTINVKRSLLAILFRGILNIGFLQFLMINLKTLIKNVKDHQIFEKDNATILKVLGFGFLIASFVLPIFRNVSLRVVTNMLGVFENTTRLFAIQWTHVFMGLVILILAYVFSYGSYLQEEHDLTV